MAQELGISEKHSDFQNPFKVDRTEVSCWGLWPCLHCVCWALGSQGLQHLEWSVRALDLEPEVPGSGSNLPWYLWANCWPCLSLRFLCPYWVNLSYEGQSGAINTSIPVHSRHCSLQVNGREAMGG